MDEIQFKGKVARRIIYSKDERLDALHGKNAIFKLVAVEETTEIKEQGVVITETPKPELTACDPEDSKPAAKVY